MADLIDSVLLKRQPLQETQEATPAETTQTIPQKEDTFKKLFGFHPQPKASSDLIDEQIRKRIPDESTQESIQRYAGSSISSMGIAGAFQAAHKVGGGASTGALAAYEALPFIGKGLAQTRLAEFKQKIPLLKKARPDVDWEKYENIDEKEYLKAVEEQMAYIPTLSNILGKIEETTGIPLTPRTTGQKLASTALTAGTFRPGGFSSKAQAAILAPAIEEGLKAVGVPEPIANFIGIGAGAGLPEIGVEAKSRPSGLPVRRYEGLEKERYISPEAKERVRSSVEKDVRGIVTNVIEKESETARKLKEDPDFPQRINNKFGEVAEKITALPHESMPAIGFFRTIWRHARNRIGKGFTPSEYEKTYTEQIEKIKEGLNEAGSFSNKRALEQYRKNNEELGQYFEPGKSKGANAAKRDALLDYNRGIADYWKQKYPNSPEIKLFEYTNKRFSELADLSTVDEFMDQVFSPEKIDFRKAQKFYDSPRVRTAFESTLGKETYQQLKNVWKDFMSTEQAMKRIKEAKALGFSDVAKEGGKWLLSPIVGKASVLWKAGKMVRNHLLANKQFRLTWKNSLSAFKRGDFKTADKEFKKLDKATEVFKNYVDNSNLPEA